MPKDSIFGIGTNVEPHKYKETCGYTLQITCGLSLWALVQHSSSTLLAIFSSWVSPSNYAFVHSFANT